MALAELKLEGLVGILTVNRPEALNALNADVMQAISDRIDEIDPNVTRCLVITGAGEKAFVAGADIAQMSKMTQQEGFDFLTLGVKTYRKIETLPIPVIAAVNGYALGGGCELSMACDIRIASEKAVFGLPETGLGITPGYSGTQRLARLVGPGRAKYMLYTASNVKAPQALEYGLVQAVYPVDTFWDEVMKLANKIAGNAPMAVRTAKKLVNDGLELPIEEAYALETKLDSQLWETQDQVEAMTAFVEKRPHAPFVNK